MKRLKLGLVGAGERGAHCYAPYALKYPGEVQFVAVAEKDAGRRRAFAAAHGIAPSMVFEGFDAFFQARPQLDGVIVATQDKDHADQAIQLLGAGYHLLLEKPMADTIEKTRAIVAAAQENDRLLMVCHVLRYTPFFEQMKRVIDSGAIGQVMAVHHLENIGNWHFAHSFVRGNWRSSAHSTPMIVAKCCHDMDIVNYLTGRKVKRLSSFGSLSYFTKENAPQGATDRCMDCPHNRACNFSCYNYLSARDMFPVFKDIVCRTDDTGAFLRHLEGSPYSRCVYKCDNDVADHQVVSMEYEGGLTVSFTASAFSSDISRHTKVMGTLGEVEGCLEDNRLHVRDFGSGMTTTHQVYAPGTLHAGGDEKIMASFLSALRDPDQGIARYSAHQSLMGHEMAFAAERSRLEGGRVIQF